MVQLTATALLLIAAVAGVEFSTGPATLAACAALLVLGLPHGSFEMLLLIEAARAGRGRPAAMLLLHLGLGAVMAALWWTLPTVALGLFLAIAVMHFAEDWREAASAFVAQGIALALIAVPALFHPREIADLLGAVATARGGALVAAALTAVAPVVLVVALVGLAMTARSGARACRQRVRRARRAVGVTAVDRFRAVLLSALFAAALRPGAPRGRAGDVAAMGTGGRAHDAARARRHWCVLLARVGHGRVAECRPGELSYLVDPDPAACGGARHRAALEQTPCGSISSARVTAPRVTVWHDGACPLCRREIAWMRRLDRRGRITFVDVSEPDATCPIDRAELLARFHANEDGIILSGAAAFAAMWRAIPLLRPLGFAAGNPVALRILDRGYSAFLRFRPRLRRYLVARSARAR